MENARFKLIQEKQFYAYFLYEMNVSFGDKIHGKKMPTACVFYSNGKLNMVINPKFWSKLDMNGKLGILQHEIDHAIFGHLNKKRKKLLDIKNESDKQILNIAKDIVINQHNEYIKKSSLKERAQLPEKYNLPSGQTLEWYFEKIKSKAKKQGGSTSEMGDSVDDHSGFGKHDVPDEVLDEIIGHVTEKAAKNTSGRIPNQALELIKQMGKSKINWKHILASFVNKNINILTKSSRARVNKRFGISYPGKRSTPKLNLSVCIDTSGSVSNDQFSQFKGEILKINNNPGVDVTIIEADCKVQRVYQLKRGSTIEKVQGRGGTSYLEALNKAQELKSDIVIYFTDGDLCASKPKKYKIPVLWAVTSDNKMPDYGRTIKVVV